MTGQARGGSGLTGGNGPPAPVDLGELLHELRTPLGAIAGFAELIRAELFGPVPERCRVLAETIAADAALILAALAALEERRTGAAPDAANPPPSPPPAPGAS